jgi:prepilin-type N-terminal cleavage/methylation domain-containing protein
MNKKGFTLLEFIVVLIVLAALVAIALPQYTGFVERSKAAEAIAVLGAVKTAEEAAKLQTANTYLTATDITNLGVTPSTYRWTYAVTPASSTSYTATATRQNTDPIGTSGSGQTVIMTYTFGGTTGWGGTHPGHP